MLYITVCVGVMVLFMNSLFFSIASVLSVISLSIKPTLAVQKCCFSSIVLISWALFVSSANLRMLSGRAIVTEMSLPPTFLTLMSTILSVRARVGILFLISTYKCEAITSLFMTDFSNFRSILAIFSSFFSDVFNLSTSSLSSEKSAGEYKKQTHKVFVR